MSLARRELLSRTILAAGVISSGVLSNASFAAEHAAKKTLDPQDWDSVSAQFNLAHSGEPVQQRFRTASLKSRKGSTLAGLSEKMESNAPTSTESTVKIGTQTGKRCSW